MSERGKQSRTALISAAMIAGLLLWAALAGAEEPVLVMPEKEFNFGYAAQGASISHPFWVKNGGGDTLHIIDVNPG